MAFVIAEKTAPFWYSVDVAVVSDEGVSRNHRFDIKYKRFSRSKLNELRAESENMSSDSDALLNDVEYVLKIAEDWRHVSDGKNELPFTEDNVRLMLDNVPGAAGAIVTKFFEATLGGGAAKKT
jgi:hypothetical protein